MLLDIRMFRSFELEFLEDRVTVSECFIVKVSSTARGGIGNTR
jgi:hypothetical protein